MNASHAWVKRSGEDLIDDLSPPKSVQVLGTAKTNVLRRQLVISRAELSVLKRQKARVVLSAFLKTIR